MSLAARYGDKELQLICDYMESACEISRRELAKMLAANGSRSSQVTATPLSAPPRGRHGDPEMEPPNVRWVVLHMIEETARHAGHLDIARELLDGQTRLGPR